jgi:hypothetical protein
MESNMKKQIKITTLEELLEVVKIKPLPECMNADFIICASDGSFVDDVKGKCALCDTPIVWRPYWTSKGPKKICMQCAIIEIGRLEEAKKKGELQSR